MAELVPCVGAVIVTAAGLLLVRRGRPPHAGFWSLPGGRVEPGETGAQAVVREVREETGLRVRADRPVGTVRRDGPQGQVYDIEDWVCSVLGGRLRAGDDAADAQFVVGPGLSGLDLTPGLVEALTEWAVLPLPE